MFFRKSVICNNISVLLQSKETQTVILTIMEVQPRQSSGTEGKSSDDIVYEFAGVVINRIQAKIVSDDILPSLLWPDNKGRTLSLTTVLLQEIDRYNKLLAMLHFSLLNLQKAIKGLVVMSEAFEEVYTALLNNQVPKMWSNVSYPSLKSLGSWIRDLELRLDFISVWLKCGPPISFWLSGFFFPQGFLTGTLQTHARKYDLPIDQLTFNFEVKKVLLDQEEIQIAHRAAEGVEDKKLYGGLKQSTDGILVHGLFLDAACWDFQKMFLGDPKPGELNPPFPVMQMTPVTERKYTGIRYEAPLYKTSIRAGVLSTTGHSTNFVIAVLLPSSQDQSYWILRGTALLSQITD